MRTTLMVMVLLALCGCGAATASAVLPVIEQALRLASDVAKQHGADLEQAPVTCEHEYDPKTKKLLILCEADLSSQSTR
jgi:uncharacterized protein YcfL